MLYSLLTSFINEFSFLNVFRYLTNDDINDNPVLNVKYLNTFKKENSFIKDVNKL